MCLLKHTLIIVHLVNLCYSEGTFDVTKYGADTKAQTKSTDAIRKAIEAAVASGGGVVHFPKGTYLTGPIHLKSNITLDLEDGTELSFSTDFNDYFPPVVMRWEGTVVNNFSPLIYGYKVENIAIRGKAVLEGNGKVWWDKWHELSADFKKNGSHPEPYQQEFFNNNNLTALAEVTMDMARINVGFLRPTFIQPFESKNILIEGVTVRNSPFWNFNPVFSENITIRDVRIEAPYTAGNTDGIDPDSCKDVLISNVTFDVGDDCIAIKSGRDKQGRDYGKPSENIVIENSLMLRGVSGVAIGSEQSGGVRNVTVRNCVFNGTDRGFFIKSTRGRGGIVENIEFKNVTVTKLKKMVFHLMMTYAESKPEPFSERTPVFRNIRFINITGDANTAAEMSGLEESLLENLEFTDVDIKTEQGFTSNFTKSIKISSSNLK